MCGRYVVYNIANHSVRFGVGDEYYEIPLDRIDNYNATPGSMLPVVTRHSPNKMQLMKWGLIPPWAKEPNIGYKLINARAESIAQKNSFNESFKKYRCLVPANGFYEWRKEKGEKVPYYFKLNSGEPFAFAGLYNVWEDPEGVEIATYTIITTKANRAVENIHDRMPVILKKDFEALWLDPNAEPVYLENILNPYDSSEMDYYQVSTDVNSPKNNYEDLLAPVESSE